MIRFPAIVLPETLTREESINKLPSASYILPSREGLGEIFVITWKIAQWPIGLAFMLLAFALIYYLAPDLHEQKWAG